MECFNMKCYILRALFASLLLGLLTNLAFAVPIVGGQLVTQEGVTSKYPFIVSLQDVLRVADNGSEEHYSHFCGGSLISERWILTAAHCIWRKDIEQIIALIGYENIDKSELLEHYQLDRVEYIYFQPATNRNDIALLRLKRAYIYPGILQQQPEKLFAQLPKLGMKANRKNACKIIGYGATRHAGPSQKQLFEAEVNVIHNAHCRRIIGHVWAPQKGTNTVCAVGNNQDTCQGDSGGPLICQYEGHDYIYGIVSHGMTCGGGVPSVYTVTLPYIDWIQLLMEGY